MTADRSAAADTLRDELAAALAMAHHSGFNDVDSLMERVRRYADAQVAAERVIRERIRLEPADAGFRCAHCGQPVRNAATIGKAKVCHTGGPYPDCYRLVTIYGEPIGARHVPRIEAIAAVEALRNLLTEKQP